MDKLRQTLLNAIEIKGVNRTEIAKSVGLKSSSRVTEFLNNGEEMAFDIVLKIVRSLNPSKEFDLMEIYIEEVSTPKNIKMAMEYSSAHRLLNSLEYLIGLTKNRTTSDLDKWSEIYSLLYTWQTLSYESIDSFYKQIRQCRTTKDELNALLMILECHVLRRMKQNDVVKIVSEIAMDFINKTKEGYVKTSFTCRLNEVLGILELKVFCDLEKAVEHAENILKTRNGHAYNGYAYYILGLSYLTESFEKSLHFLNESVREYKKSNCFINIKAVKGNISLLHFYWSKTNNNEGVNDIYNKAVKREQIDKNNTDDSQKHLLDTPLGQFLTGYSSGDRDVMLESIYSTAENSDKFLTKIYKQKLNELLGNGSNDIDYIQKMINIA